MKLATEEQENHSERSAPLGDRRQACGMDPREDAARVAVKRREGASQTQLLVQMPGEKHRLPEMTLPHRGHWRKTAGCVRGRPGSTPF